MSELNSQPHSLNLEAQELNLQSQKSQSKSQDSRLCKAINTWLIKQTAYKMRNPKRRHDLRRLQRCLEFFAPLIRGDEKISAAARVYFYRNKNTIITKLKRANHSPKLKLLINKYPKLNIARAYKYAILFDKLALKNDDIKFFEELILIATEKE